MPHLPDRTRRTSRGTAPSAVVAALLTAVLVVAVAGCGSDGDGSGAATTGSPTTGSPTTGSPTSGPPADEVLRVLVTNDDGVGAPGIDAVVEALRALPATEVTVVAPAANQSGTGGRTTPGGAAAADATTASGYPATSVDGFPADAVAVALGRSKDYDLVVSGVNAGQNLGAATGVSGTVGAARAAATAGVPAVAVSAGFGEPPDFAAAVEEVLAWLGPRRADLVAGDVDVVGVWNLNVPTCADGERRGVVEVPVAPDGDGAGDPADCAATSPKEAAADDIDAFRAGWVPLSFLPLAG